MQPYASLLSPCWLGEGVMVTCAIAARPHLEWLAPARLGQSDPANHLKELTLIHGILSDIIVAASPHRVLLLASGSARGGFWRSLGPIRLIRGMVIVAVICLAAFIALSLTPEVSIESISKNVFEADSYPLLLNLLFLLTAAGLGACFAALFQANRYIAGGPSIPSMSPRTGFVSSSG
jgi:hypothetical protein